MLSDNKRAIAADDAAIRKSDASGARLLTARALFFQCRAFANLGQPQDSQKACDRARHIYEDSGDLAGEGQALHSATEVPLDQGNLSQAAGLYQQALTLARRTGDKRAIARELGNLGLIEAEEGNTASAEKTYAESLQDFRDVGDKHGMAVVEGNTGDLFRREGRLGEALAEYRDALLLAREVGHKSSEAINLQLIADVLRDQGELNSSMQLPQQAAGIQQQINDEHFYANTLVEIGQLHRQQDDSDGAKKSYEEALAIRQQGGEKDSLAETQVFLAELACDSNHGPTAEKLAQDAVQEFQTDDESDSQILALALLSRSLLEQGKIPGAQAAIGKAKTLSAKSSGVSTRLVFQLDSAYALAAAKDFNRAEQLARGALAEAKNHGFYQRQLEASLALGEIQMAGQDPAAGRAVLLQLARDARARGFLLIARKASAALASKSAADSPRRDQQQVPLHHAAILVASDKDAERISAEVVARILLETLPVAPAAGWRFSR